MSYPFHFLLSHRTSVQKKKVSLSELQCKNVSKFKFKTQIQNIRGQNRLQKKLKSFWTQEIFALRIS